MMHPGWQTVFSKMTCGVYVLTTAYRDKKNGMIASWVSQISYEPPLLTVAVHPKRYTHRLIEQSGCFALHLLPRSKKDYLTRFKGPDPEKKFEGIDWRVGAGGCPILQDCVGYIECDVVDSIAPGNHTLFIGRAVNAKNVSEEPVLTTLDYSGSYTGKD